MVEILKARSGDCYGLYGATENSGVYIIPSARNENTDNSLLVCGTYLSQIKNPSAMDNNHWRCPNGNMWSRHRPVKIMTWRLPNRLGDKGWPLDLLNMVYLDGEELVFAKDSDDHLGESEEVIHKDSNGTVLSNGDNVMLIRNLKVKSTGVTTKRDTVVRRITLDPENAQYIKGKVEGQQIVILT